MTDTVTIRGYDELVRKLNKLPDNVKQAMRNAIKASTVHVQGKIAKYPPATDANSPSQPRWYQRGYGPRWRRRDGSIGGSKTSEQLGQKWTIKIQNDGMTGIVGTNVSYAPYVQDTERQATVMKGIGWKTTGEVAEEETPEVMRFINAEIQKALNK